MRFLEVYVFFFENKMSSGGYFEINLVFSTWSLLTLTLNSLITIIYTPLVQFPFFISYTNG